MSILISIFLFFLTSCSSPQKKFVLERTGVYQTTVNGNAETETLISRIEVSSKLLAAVESCFLGNSKKEFDTKGNVRGLLLLAPCIPFELQAKDLITSFGDRV